MRCWGRSDYGQLGNNSLVNSLVPVQALASGGNVWSVAVGDSHSCASVNGGVVCWGDGADGQGADPAVFYQHKVYATLKPLSAPTAPAITSATSGPGTATLNIAPPSSTGGMPITGYTATCTAAGRPTVTASAAATATSITVTGLIGGVAYHCTVSANNALGAGTASTSATVTPSAAPRSVALNTPVDHAAYVAPASITLAANPVPGAGATVTKVEFFAGSTLIGTVTGSPYSSLWNATLPGNYVLTAKLTDSLGGTATSAPVNVTITAVGETITYLHNDFAGSPMAATDVSGAVIWKESYQPFGGQVRKEAASAGNRQFFTGKPFDADSGLSYFGARYYDPVIGRFMGVDPVGFDEKNLHSFNRYAYANNNPYRFVDPDGNSPLDIAFLVYDIGNLGYAIYTGVGIGEAAVGVGLSAVGVIVPIPGAGLALKAERAAHAVDAARAAGEMGVVSKGADKVVYRLGESAESASRLGRKSAEAEQVIGQHGVSVSTTKPPAGTPCSSASCSDLKARGFEVRSTPTRNDPNHHTVVLPKPVTKEVAKDFNQAFGRD